MKRRNSIELLFSLSLFTIFVICAFMVLLLQVQSYRSITSQSQQMEQTHTPLAYLHAKVRSSDKQNAIDVMTVDGVDALRIHDEANDASTYIYEYEGKLMELYVSEDVDVMLSAGTPMFDIQDFSVKKTGNQLKMQVQDNNAKTNKIVLSLKSE